MQPPEANLPATVIADRNSSDSRPGPLILVGASVRSAAESARRAGFQPIAWDRYGDRDTRAAAEHWLPLDSSPTPSSLRESLRKLDQIGATNTPLQIAGGLHGGYDWLRDCRRKFLGADLECISRTAEIEFLAPLAAHARVAFPESVRLSPISGPASGHPMPGRWLVKRSSSSGGLGVRWQAVQPSPSHGSLQHASILQRFTSGRAVGVSYLGDGNQAICLGACRLITRRFGDLPFVYTGAIGPLKLCDAVTQQLRRIGDAFVKHWRFVGPFNADVILQAESVSLIEINPRWSGSMELIERSWSETLGEPCSLFESPAIWQARLHRRCADTPAPPRFLKRVLFARRTQWVSPLECDQRAARSRWQFKDVPNQPTKIVAGQPIATLIAPLTQTNLPDLMRYQWG
ncbi:ATP-grasp domain-containing protein [Stieleria sp. TO1_6]|uniref:ATP-grasp domain-containing protein n=1 Tax=Stieleria tagensis TaxID=2956795 RepID=UPI00209B38AE|nr:ATP-grasp domain-containing protein [Stieleria tagensis]MCO8123245.1 ATP-grasp domain-containing protein [Stieleria tagensis]